MILTGDKRNTRQEISPSATLSTTNPTWAGLEFDSGIRRERLTTNRLSHGKQCIYGRLGTCGNEYYEILVWNVEKTQTEEQRFFFCVAQQPYSGLTVEVQRSYSHTHRTRQDSSGRGIGPSQSRGLKIPEENQGVVHTIKKTKVNKINMESTCNQREPRQRQRSG